MYEALNDSHGNIMQRAAFARHPSALDALASRRNGYHYRAQHLDGDSKSPSDEKKEEKKDEKKTADEPSLVDKAVTWVKENQVAAVLAGVVVASVVFKKRAAIQQALPRGV